MESPLRLLPLECTQAHSHHEQNKIQTVTVNLTQCDCLYPCPFHITSLFHGGRPLVLPVIGSTYRSREREPVVKEYDGIGSIFLFMCYLLMRVMRCQVFCPNHSH